MVLSLTLAIDSILNRYVAFRVIYKEIWVSIIMIEYTIFARSNTILFDQNACLLTYNIMDKGLVKILLNQVEALDSPYPLI